MTVPKFPAEEQIPNPEAALEEVDHTLSTERVDPLPLQIRRARILRQLGRLDEARQMIDHVVDQDLGQVEAHFMRARDLFESGQINDGWLAIEDAVAADRNHGPSIMVKFGLGSENNPDALAKTVAWATSRQSWRAFYCAALQCSQQGDEAGFREYAEAAHRIAPDEPDVQSLRAQATA